MTELRCVVEYNKESTSEVLMDIAIRHGFACTVSADRREITFTTANWIRIGFGPKTKGNALAALYTDIVEAMSLPALGIRSCTISPELGG